MRGPKRRWFQFSLRTLLLIIFLASVGMSTLGVKMHRARKQRQIVAAILKLGGGVQYDYHDGICDPRKHPPVPAWQLKVFGDDFFSDVVGVGFFRKAHLRDEDLARLENLAQLEFVMLERVPITDKALEHFKGLGNLRYLSLVGTQVTEEGIAQLAKALPECTIISGDRPKADRSGE